MGISLAIKLAWAVAAAVILALLVVALDGDDDTAESPAALTGSLTPSNTPTASLTPSPSATLRPGETPSPTPTPESPIPIPAGCERWPEDIFPVFEKLSLASALCLRTAEDIEEMPRSCHAVRACYVPSTRTVWELHTDSRDVLEPSPLLTFSDEFVLVHELCHAHQHWQIIKDGVADPLDTPAHSWQLTREGRAFLELGRVLPQDFIPLAMGGPVETFANACAAWLYPEEGFQQTWVGRFPELRAFMETWLFP